MANSGIKASQAGTTLKTALANMSAPTDKQAAAMDRLDISMTNTDGSMKTMMELTQNLRSSFAGLSEAEQTAAASALSSAAGGKSVSVELLGSQTPHYASGTESAEPGFALVGEEGPELVYFGGGEKVVNASETATMRASPGVSAMVAPISSGGNSPVTIQVSFNIQGNATPETVESLRMFGDDFAERVWEVVSNKMTDQTRRAMA